MRCISLGRWLGLGCVTAVVGTGPAQAQVAQFSFALPAQELSLSLRAVSLRTGRNVIAPGELVSGRRAPAVSGSYTAETAVRSLLTGSGLDVRPVGETLVVYRPAVAVAEPVTASGRDNEPIVVTGTHIRGAQPTSPIIVIGREEIDRSGATSVEELMRTLPQNTQGGVNEENFAVPLPDKDPSDHGAGLNLRGLGQRATLVLVNGRRLAPTNSGSFVDVSLIPLSAVERVEVLTDGASAIYGSDAVGGVVNFILRDRLEGLETSLQAGIATQGGGEQLLLSQSGGHDWSSGRALLAYEYRLENEVEAGDRGYTINLRPDTHLLPRERRHSVLAMVEQDLSSRLTADVTASFARRSTRRTYFQSGSPLPVGGDARAKSVGLTGGLSYDLGAWQLRLDANYARSDARQDQTQPGGVELVNGRDVRNAILEGGVRLDGRMLELPAGSVRLAVGAQARRETYRDLFQSSAIPPILRTAKRRVQSAFGELLIPLFSERNRRPGLERLQLSAAARYDRYSGTGGAVDPKLGLLWSPVRGLTLRGSYSTSFRAPLLSEISGVYSGIYVPAAFFYANPAEAPADSLAFILQGSNPEVRPETSRNWAVGGDWAPTFAPGLQLRFNYYAIRFSDRIALPAAIANVIGDPAYASIVAFDPDLAALTALVGGADTVIDFSGPGFSDGGAVPADVDVLLDTRVTNTAFTTTRGFDLGLRYAFGVGPHSFVLDANVSHIVKFDEQLTPTGAVIRAVDQPYRPLDWRARGGVAWSRGGWAGSLFVNHADGYRDDRLPVGRRVASHTTLDASLAYTMTHSWLRGMRVSVYAENLLDNDPPHLQPNPGFTSGPGYDPVNASARGRFLSVQLRKSW